ncbi:hypothetical protein BDBG_09034 [Blastomyces gilchristii SLH14081]|uniref:Uncharacterized protein n=1 Tax=Blastomyces gilchristii (strain SLH14081) TaxID=559298 RepID=A0A179V3E0_BLAGS|nr:uncharacterized protein BDBG_09034 [Blastomyces gilchristii SLH14081]OAT13927.1 hypothetical protein BDBG_09034 [Blastomyces gilchristii SLH14081]
MPFSDRSRNWLMGGRNCGMVVWAGGERERCDREDLGGGNGDGRREEREIRAAISGRWEQVVKLLFATHAVGVRDGGGGRRGEASELEQTKDKKNKTRLTKPSRRVQGFFGANIGRGGEYATEAPR